MTDHDAWRESAGAYVLGALDADERRGFEEHMGGCERCRDEVLSLAPLPALLGRLDPEDLVDHGGGAGGAEALVAAVRADVAALERGRRRWRAVAAAAVLALVVGAVGVVAGGVGSGGSGGSGGVERDGVVLAATSPAGVRGEVVADPRAWGTYVHLSVDDLPERERYEVWVVDRAGTWHHAGSWGPSATGAAGLGASTHVHIEGIDRVVVTSTDRSDVLLTAAPPL